MTRQGDFSQIDESELPGFLRALIDELRQEIDHNPELDPSRTASELAPEQRHLITNRGEPDNLTVLQALRELGMLSADDLEMQRKAAPSYDTADATIEAMVTSSLETFIRVYLEYLLVQRKNGNAVEGAA